MPRSCAVCPLTLEAAWALDRRAAGHTAAGRFVECTRAAPRPAARRVLVPVPLAG